MIELFHVWKSYHRRCALRDITLTIEKGEFVVVTGPSGAGKSTLLKLLFCAERPDEGQVFIQGRSVARLRPSEVPYLRRRMGFVFQEFHLLPKRTVFDNVALPLLAHGASLFDLKRKVNEALMAVGMEHKKDSWPSMLSAGEQQRACIARAIVHSPVVLLADEPTGNLDHALAGEVLGLLTRVHARGTTVLLATHDQAFARRSPGRRLRLDHGRLHAEQGGPCGV